MPKPKRSQTRRDALQGVTQSAYARRRGVSREAVRKAVESGRIPTIGRHKRIDPKKADRAMRENTDQSKVRGREAERNGHSPTATRKGPTLNESKTRRETALAELAEIELARSKGEVVLRSEVSDAANQCARLLKERVLAVPGQIMDALEGLGLKDTITGQRLITDELRQALESIANELADEEPAAAPSEPAAPPVEAKAS